MPLSGRHTGQDPVAREAQQTGTKPAHSFLYIPSTIQVHLKTVPYLGQSSLPGIDEAVGGLTLSQCYCMVFEQNFRTCTLNLADWISTLEGLHLDVQT